MKKAYPDRNNMYPDINNIYPDGWDARKVNIIQALTVLVRWE